ncbi:hypothetical protein SDC9_138544 [bioreactor metagenome]|uniref:Uncharacterized protein n=1 Tax=bioreactor metagenome TaxID=1076179 RepID=A0A645DQ76_9ZZZZ
MFKAGIKEGREEDKPDMSSEPACRAAWLEDSEPRVPSANMVILMAPFDFSLTKSIMYMALSTSCEPVLATVANFSSTGSIFGVSCCGCSDCDGVVAGVSFAGWLHPLKHMPKRVITAIRIASNFLLIVLPLLHFSRSFCRKATKKLLCVSHYMEFLL